MFNKFIQNKADKTTQQDAEVAEKSLELEVLKPVPSGAVGNTVQKPSIISEGAVFEGNLLFNGILHLDGKFKGNIKADKITIGRNGSFNGKFEADTVIVFGELQGEIACKDLTLNSGSNVNGKINYSTIKVQPGSSVSGELNCTLKK